MRALSAVLAATVALAPMVSHAQSVTAEVISSDPAVPAVSDRPDTVTVVIYRDQPVETSQLMALANQRGSSLRQTGLALIVEKRRIGVPAGEGVVRFKGLATGIVPHSVTIEGLPADILEQNADYDLISPRTLLEKSVGQAVTMVRTYVSGDEEQVRGVLRAGANGAVVEFDDGVEALDCTGMSERLVFDHVPNGLGATPTLSIRTRAAQTGEYDVTLAYLATELQWSADYVARLSQDGRSLDLQGWITLANLGGTSFADAPVVVVAGDLSRDSDTQPVRLLEPRGGTTCWPTQTTDQVGQYGGAPPPPPPPAPPAMRPSLMRDMVQDIVVTGNRVKARQEELGDYKAYVLPHLTTVAARQMKQVLFLDQENVPLERFQTLELVENSQPQPTTTVIRLRNRVDQGLGLPMPGGKVVFMVPDAEHGPMLGGESGMEDTPVDLPIRWEVGQASDVTAEITRLEGTSRGKGHRRRAVESHRVELVNHSPEGARVELTLPSLASYNCAFRIEREGVRSRIDPDRGIRTWSVDLEAGATRSLDVQWSYCDPN